MTTASGKQSNRGTSRARRRPLSHVLTLVSVAAIGACASPEPRPSPPPVAATPPPVTEVYFYPNRGQGPAQQDQDRYECYLWAKKQTGFDPSAPQLAPHQQVQVVPSPPPGANTAVGAFTGAVIGSIVAPYGRSAEGAAVGAVAGAIAGAASDTARQQQAAEIQKRYNESDAQRAARLEQQASAYRRAMGACLEGRGYTVR
jgi:hypothetical protein